MQINNAVNALNPNPLRPPTHDDAQTARKMFLGGFAFLPCVDMLSCRRYNNAIGLNSQISLVRQLVAVSAHAVNASNA